VKRDSGPRAIELVAQAGFGEVASEGGKKSLGSASKAVDTLEFCRLRNRP
jgi:hypothetical protein